MAKKMRHIGLVNHLRHWGLKVEESKGWRHRGRPYDFNPRAIMVHHTASGAQSGNFASENVVTHGRSGLPGPLSQVLLGRDGTVKLIAAGYCNHAGYGGPRAGIPANMGNTFAIGIEAENNGVGEPWSKEQLNAYYRLCAALMDWIGINDVSRVIGHKEWASGRKIDPAGIDMNRFRYNVARALHEGTNGRRAVPTVRLKNLKYLRRSDDVLKVKRRLTRRGFSINDNKTKFFGPGLKHDYKHWQLHLGYRGKDADGTPGRASLRKLGFRVLR